MNVLKANGGFHPKTEAWKLTKNKLEKLVNSMKIDFYFPV